MSKKSVQCHVDGSVINHGQPSAQGGYGVQWSGSTNMPNISRPLSGPQTSSRAEAQAVRAAVQQARSHGHRNVVVHTDSRENVRGLAGNATVHRDVWSQTNKVQQGMNVQVRQVPRQANQAHGLAKSGAQSGAKSGAKSGGKKK